jgi:hypothetical protein
MRSIWKAWAGTPFPHVIRDGPGTTARGAAGIARGAHVAGAIEHTAQEVLRQAPTGQQVLHRTKGLSEQLARLEGARGAARGVSAHGS